MTCKRRSHSPLAVRMIGSVGFAMCITGLHRWDWLYTDPRVWWRPWQGAFGLLLCGVASAHTVWNRATPYTAPDSVDPNATIILGLDTTASDELARSKNGHPN
jgi:hypothetical protein